MERLIKKYKNRRLYDTETSQYITVEDLTRYVLDGIDFRVEDSSTEADITNATLLQIFVEMESGTSQFLSRDMLTHMIILAHHPMSQNFKSMLEQFFKTMQTTMKTNPYLGDYQKSAQQWGSQMQELMKQWFKS